jgi:Fe2+ or Zn2+ uptake regulation protein
MPATPLTVEVLAALRRIGCPVTTTDLMRLLNRDRATLLVVDQVYRAVDALRARGAVGRLKAPSNKRVRYWEVADGPGACHCGAAQQGTS